MSTREDNIGAKKWVFVRYDENKEETPNFKLQTPINKIQFMNELRHKYDLEERTKSLAISVIVLFRSQTLDYMDRSIVVQLLRAVTSVGANYCEASECITRKDYRHKISICKKEVKEVRFWLSVMKPLFPLLENKWIEFEGEALELTLIFASIIRKLDVPKES